MYGAREPHAPSVSQAAKTSILDKHPDREGMSMIDHSGITVCNLENSKAFYTKALGALGYVPIICTPEAVSFGVREGHGKSTDPGGDFWLSEGTPMAPRAHFA